MAHDGQDLQMKPIVLPELLALTGAAIAPLEATLEAARVAVRNQVTQEGRVSGQLIEANQTAAHGLSWLACEENVASCKNRVEFDWFMRETLMTW